MSGHNKSSVDELDSFVKSIDSYIIGEDVQRIQINPEVEAVLNLTGVELKALSSEDCCEKAYCLYAYCSYIQSVFNRHQVKLYWCDSQINRMVAKQAGSFSKYMKWEQKYYTVVEQDEFVKKIFEAKLVSEARVIWLTDKIRDMRKMADTLMELSKRKTYS